MTMSDNMPGSTGMTNSQHVTAFFDTREDAEAAMRRIEAEGIATADIRLVEGGGDTAVDTPHQERGFFEALGDLFMPEEDRYSYAEGLSRGGYLLSVLTTASNRDRILDILDDEGTIDMDERETTWRNEGWTGAPVAAGATTTAGSDFDTARTGGVDTGRIGGVDETIEVVEENLRVSKRETDHGRVRVRSYVVETPVEEEVTLRDEEVHVTRRAVDRPVSSGEALFDDKTLEATEHHEEAVVSKDARVTEEITLDSEASERTETVRDTVRRTEVEIEDERTETDRKIDR